MLNKAVEQEPLKSALAKACEDAEKETGSEAMQASLGEALKAAREETMARNKKADEDNQEEKEGKGDDGDGSGAEDTTVIHGARWHLLSGALTLEEQAHLFGFIHERDVTDWEKLAPCMSPTPKTLELAQEQGAQTTRVLNCDANEKTAVVEMVAKAIGILLWRKAIKSMTVAAIRYCASGSHPCIGSCFPPHIDHCNDGSWVVLFSLGRTAMFHIQAPGMGQRYTFDMNSGDVLVFDPSSEAAVVHGVAGVKPFEEEAGEERFELGARFDDLRSSRFGVQCRVAFTE
jgi:hypothetical protein